VVLSGPLRGVRLAVSNLERPSFFLGRYEPYIVTTLRERIQPGMVVYDVGAHIGYLTLVMSRLVGSTGRVLSFEPDPRNREALNANASEMSNVKVFPLAIDGELGEVQFATFGYSLVGRIADADTPGDATMVTVQAVPLDHLINDRGEPVPQFIKIDVEGREVNVLEGAHSVLNEHRPTVIVETRRWSTFPEVASLMAGCGYNEAILREDESGVMDVLYTPRA
jgi:FkbM family methyltransferase